MAAGDIQLRDNGATEGDIALSGGTSSSAGVAALTWDVYDAEGTTTPPAFVFSVVPELGFSVIPQSEVFSVVPETAFSTAPRAEIFSVVGETAFSSQAHVDVFSVVPELGFSVFQDPYQPYSQTSGGALCVPYTLPMVWTTITSFCSPFAIPDCSGSGGSSSAVLLAFQKSAADTVLLCTRGLSGLFPTGGLSILTWGRLDAFSAAGVQVPIISGSLTTIDGPTSGWRLVYGGSAAPTNDLIQYRDTGGALRSDSDTFSGGTLVGAGWHALGGFRQEGSPWLQRAFVDDQVNAGTNGTVAPGSGTQAVVTLFGESGGAYFTGQILCPLLITADEGSDGDDTVQLQFFTDLGKRDSAVFSNPALVLAPRARSSVTPGDAVEIWTINKNSVRVEGPVVYGTPGFWRGPGFGLNFADIHWISVPWSSASLSAGKTLLLGLQGNAVPGASQYATSRSSAGGGGLELLILNTDGTDCTANFYDAFGVQVATITLDVSETLGNLTYYAIRIGVDGVAECSLEIFDASGTSINEGTNVPSGTVSIEQNQRWGRGTSTGSAYTSGTCFCWVEFNGTLSDEQVSAYLAGDLGAPVPLKDIRGCDSNVWDDGDPVRLWGLYDATGTYGSSITFESIGSDEIVVGS